MQLSTHTDYSLRLLIYLAMTPNENQQHTVQDASRRYHISNHHLAKVAQKLVQLGYIYGHRGRGGGLKLAKPPEDIRLGQLIRETENLQLLECFSMDPVCPIEPVCKLKHLLAKAQLAFLTILDDYTLSDLVTNKHKLSQLLQFN
jgi:Rrf2 family nitric oxide-sensitive transcriptional repressor